MSESTVIELLERALKASKLELSEFGSLGPKAVFGEDLLDYPTCEDEVTPFIKQRVRLHHESWITSPIREALILLRGFNEST